MKKRSVSIGSMKKPWLIFLHRHQTLLALLLFLSILAASSNVLRGDISSSPTGSSSPEESSENIRACSSKNTLFMNLETLKEALDLFQGSGSEIIAEREKYLGEPSAWTCLSAADGGGEPGIEKLKKLANNLPLWHYKSALGVDTVRPVTFSSLSTVLGEFEREYECKLSEFTRAADSMVMVNLDLDTPKSYCCNDQDNCVHQDATTNCATIASDDYTCGGSCLYNISQSEVTGRAQIFRDRIEREKQRARIVTMRTMHALRSFEMNYAYAKELTCFQRASLDLKNELSLLADATSCLPKIWDAVTSLHDRDSSLTPTE